MTFHENGRLPTQRVLIKCDGSELYASEPSRNSVVMPTSLAEVDALYVQLQRRLIESGEWDRIRAIFASKLNESGWFDDLRHRSRERAKATDTPPFQELYNEFAPHAQASLPLATKREVMSLIRQYLDKQFV